MEGKERETKEKEEEEETEGCRVRGQVAGKG